MPQNCVNRDINIFASTQNSNNKVTQSIWNTSLTVLPTAIINHVMAASNTNVYSFGGTTTTNLNTAVNTVNKYTISTNIWTTMTAMNHKRSGGIACTVGNYIWYIGGIDETSVYQKTVHRYDISGDSWSADATYIDMTAIRAYSLGVTDGSQYIYVIGGFDGSNIQGTIYRYDTTINTWSTLTPMPSSYALYKIGGALIGDYIYVLAGNDGSTNITCYKYKISTDSWTKLSNYPYSTYGIGFFSFNKHIYYVSGSGTANKRFLRYNTHIDVWEFLVDYPTSLSYGLSATVVGNIAYVTGGYTGSAASTAHNAYYL